MRIWERPVLRTTAGARSRTLPTNKNNRPTERLCDCGDPTETRTRVTAVKGRCLNRLTMGPILVAAVGFEPTTCRV